VKGLATCLAHSPIIACVLRSTGQPQSDRGARKR
jgi:hypothetical protein